MNPISTANRNVMNHSSYISSGNHFPVLLLILYSHCEKISESSVKLEPSPSCGMN